MGNSKIGCCLDCQERYPGCHDHCERYQDASEKWRAFKQQVKEAQFDEFFSYKLDKIKKEKRRGNKWQMKSQ